jgi:hypothetical protein
MKMEGGLVLYKSNNVLWNPVGLDEEEILVVHEAVDTNIYIISGKTGAAIWSRIDGKNSVADIGAEMAEYGQISPEEASKMLNPFLADLEHHELIQKTRPPSMETEPEDPPIPWPEILSTPVFSPFHPESFVSSNIVALGSFQGSQNNAGGTAMCTGGLGGLNDVGGGDPCHAAPGDGYGFINLGWYGQPCST